MIPGITDRQRLPRLGKIRLGEKRESGSGGKKYPAAWDHFNFKDVPELEQLFPSPCKEIGPILLPLEDEEGFMPTARKAYSASGLFCACSDGETATRVNKGLDEESKQPIDPQGYAFLQQMQEKTGQVVEVGSMFDLPCPGEECNYFERGYCKNLARLFIVVVGSPRYGVYEISTTSINGMRNVLSSARAIKATTGGRITGIPLKLKLSPLRVQPDGKAKTVFVLELEFYGESDMNKHLNAGALGKLLTASRTPLGQNIAIAPAPESRQIPADVIPDGGAALSRALGEPTPGDDHDEDNEKPDPREIFGKPGPADKAVAEKQKDNMREALAAGSTRGKKTAPAKSAPAAKPAAAAKPPEEPPPPTDNDVDPFMKF